MNVRIKVNMADAVKVPKEIRAEVDRSMDGTSGGEFDAMYRQWAKRYEAFVRRRFDRASKGDGSWAPLTKETILRRRAAKGGTRRQERDRLRALANKTDNLKREKALRQKARSMATMAGISILRDTGALFAALTIGTQGNYLRRFRGGIRYGFANVKVGKRGPSLSQLAAWHDAGAGHLPQRRILVDPDKQVIDGMRSDARTAIGAMLNRIKAKKVKG